MIILNHKYRSSRNVLIIAFIGLIILPTFALGWISFSYSKDIIKNKISAHIAENLEQTNLNIEEKASVLETLLNTISTDKEVVNVLRTVDFHDYNSDLLERFTNLDKIFRDLIANYNLAITNVLLINEQGMYNLNERVYLERDQLIHADWYQQTLALNGKLNWIGLSRKEGLLSNGAYEINVSKTIIDSANFQRLGVVYLALRPNYFGKFVNSASPGESISVQDATGRIMISSDLAQEQTSNQAKYLTIHSNPNKYGWVVIKSIPMAALTEEIARIRNFTILIIAICVLIFAVCLYLIYRGISRPLEHMVNLLNDIDTSNENLDLRKFPLYELLKIQNSMVSLIEKNKTARKKSKELELGKLQAQVNPHFLYNTLNSINQMAVLNNQESISRPIVSLIKFLKSSIGRDGDFVTVEKELENVKHYLIIQNAVYHDQIDVVYEIDETLLQKVIPNFLLQPLVENSICHGVDPRQGNGRITIRCYRSSGQLMLEVEDNGAGMEQTKIDELVKDAQGHNILHMGVRNTHEKIQLIYGPPYGLNISSERHRGTKVQVILPIGT